jgi:hypothetical protein
VVYPPRSSAANQGSRQPIDKRERTERQAEAKRRKIENGEEIKAPIYATEFSKEEIANEERRPKKKAAVLLGYSGTGYYGMQLFVPSQPIAMQLACVDRNYTGMRTRRPSRAISSRLSSQPELSPRPTPRTPRNRHSCAAPVPTRACTLPEMLSL